jgi:hypothetical protein
MKTKYDTVVLGVAIARDGSLCLESKSPVDIEEALGLYHSNIVQNALTFSFAARVLIAAAQSAVFLVTTRR